MDIKDDEASIAQKQKDLAKAVLEGELAAVNALKAIVNDKNADAGVRLSASHLLLQARRDLKQANTTTKS